MTDTPVIETTRLTLRVPTPRDLDAYRAFYAVSDVTVGGYRSGRTDDEVAAILERDIAHWATKGFGMFLLRQIGEDAVLGGAGLLHPDGWPGHEMTWWLMPEARGQGYATEASRAVIGFAHETLGWSRVETFMRDGNARAHALARRLGGRVDRRETFPDGVTRDVYRLSREPVSA